MFLKNVYLIPAQKSDDLKNESVCVYIYSI